MELTTTYEKDNYTIYVDHHIFKDVLSRYTHPYEDIYYLIDTHVYDLHFDKFKTLENVIRVPRGESFKTIDNVMEKIDDLLDQNIKRNDLIVVIGGGATGDAGAFLSSITLRGIDYIHVPTTLLAHDSAIGGKTAINRPNGKNLVGTFYRPKAVIYDLDFFKTLPEDEIMSGFGEVIKHTMLDGQESLNNLIDLTKDGIPLNALTPFIVNGIKTKMYYVTVDETESNLRRYLNLGHTLGHALEYSFRIKHGHAVVLGIIASLYISETMYSGAFNVNLFIEYIKGLNYDLTPLREMNISEMIGYMENDKKNQHNNFIGFIILKEYGKPEFVEIGTDDLERLLNEIKVML